MTQQTLEARPAAKADRWLPIRKFALALANDAQWQAAESGIEQRDLGLAEASEGAMQARYLRNKGAEGELPASSRGSGTHFHLFHVMQGSITLLAPDGSRTVLQAGDCVHQPELAARQRVLFGVGAEVLELTAPVKPAVDGKPFELEPAETAARPVLNRDQPSAYVQGDGPRSYFLYRDLGVAAATERRVHIHVLKATAPSMPGGTGTHTHTMCQLFYVFRGWADLEVGGQQSLRMQAGDAMCISAGTAHNVPAFSEDYAIIEVCIPADYDTTDA